MGSALIREIAILPADFPLRDTFRTNLGEKKLTKNVLVHLRGTDGLEGWGEAASSLAMPESSQGTMSSVLTQGSALCLETKISDWQRTARLLRQKFPGHPTAVSALECALLDAFCRSKKMPLNRFFGDKNVPVETYFTIPALELKDCKTILMRMRRKGFKKFKVKLTGKNFAQDFEKVRLVSEISENHPMILDPNQAWTVSYALKFMKKALSQNLKIALIEQPLERTDLTGLAALKKLSPFPVAVDESLRSMEDAKNIVRKEAADVFNIKVAKLGLLPALEIVQYLKKMKKRLMIGSMMESPLGLAASVSWAAGSGDFEFADLDTFLLLKPTPFRSCFTNRGPVLRLAPGTRLRGPNHD